MRFFRKYRTRSVISIFSLMLLWISSSPSMGQFISLEPVVTGLGMITDITHAGDGSGRLFILQQQGQIRIYDGQQVLPTPFLDITPLVLSGGEQGLLGLAFHPDYRNNGIFFVNYTRRPDGATVVSAHIVSAKDPNVADPNFQFVMLTIPQPFSNHNGGQIKFGPDGYLYIGMGDGGSAGDPQNRAQNLGELLGKMLRIDVNSGEVYGIPPTNPFVGVPGARPEIWAYGLRNPWRFSFDRQTGDLFTADVGQDRLEEVNWQPSFSPGGENYGWRLMEGTSCFNPPANCNDGTLTLPVLEYDHGLGCSITGGYVYRGQAFPAWQGVYFYADYCTGRIWGAVQNEDGTLTALELLESPHNISTFGEDEAGELYLSHHSSVNGTVFLIIMN